ncbi:MAG: hypothetical protein C0514_01090 [Candidatus Puniceispirillum sp.]|nr:hypothetical protein [Candidatus Puniceispirillum sp.]
MDALPQDTQKTLKRIRASTHISHAVDLRYHPRSIPVYFVSRGGTRLATFGQENKTTLAEALSSPSLYCNLRLPDNEDRRPALLPLAFSLAKERNRNTLKLHHEWFSARSIPVLTAAIKENSHLRTLSLDDNALGDTGLLLLLGALLHHPLTKLSLHAVRVTKESLPYLRKFLEENNTLTSLDASYNNLGDEAMIHLGLALVKNTSLQHLKLSGNCITSQGATTLAELGLARNITLTFLRLSSNQITDAGAVALFENSCGALSISLCWNSGTSAKIRQHIEDSTAGRISFR